MKLSTLIVSAVLVAVLTCVGVAIAARLHTQTTAADPITSAAPVTPGAAVVTRPAVSPVQPVPAPAVAPSAATPPATQAVAPAAPGQTPAMTLKQLGNFPYDPEKGGGIPERVKALDGKTVKLRGVILPLSQAAQITEFALVADRFSCCFGTAPQVQHIAMVRLPRNKAIDYTDSEVWVEGTLHVKEEREDDFTVSIFSLDGTSVKIAK